jgi:hypothetical protein
MAYLQASTLKGKCRAGFLTCPESGRQGRFSNLPYISLSRQQALYLMHHTLDFFLVCESDHEEFVSFTDADDAVRKEPDAVEQRIGAEDQAHRKSCDSGAGKRRAD